MAFPTDPLTATFELALGADLTAEPSTWTWTDISAYCRAPVNIRAGRSDEQSSSSTGQMTLVVDNADGRFTRRNPTGAWYGQLVKGTPIRVHVTDGVIAASTRFTGQIAELPPRWSTGLHDRWVPIVANGVFRRLEQQVITESAVKRFVLAETGLRSYWPVEDGRGTGQYAASAVYGQDPLWVETDQGGGDATEANWASHSDLPGSGSLAGFDATARLHGWVNSAAIGPWALMFFAKGELKSGSIDGTWTSARIIPAGSDVEYRIEATDASVTCAVINRLTGATVTTLNSTTELGTLSLLGGWHSIALMQSAAGTATTSSISLFVDGESGDTATLTGYAPGRMNRIVVPNVFDTADITGMAVGHVAVFDDADYGRPAAFHAAGSGYAGETAADRIRRVCQEQGLAFTVAEGLEIGGVPASSRMGPQPTGDVASILRECEAADGGLLYETPDAGTGYVARSALYDAAAISSSPDIALDRALRQLGDVFEPSDDDQYLTNDVTVSRSGGSSARVQSIPEGALAAPSSASINVSSDGALAHQASWRVHLGTEDEYRFPVIELNLATNPGLIDEWVAARIGSRVTIANPPPGMPPDLLDLIIVGYTEVIGSFEWRVRLHCAPAAPYRVAQLPGDLTVVSEDFEDLTFNVTVTNGGDAAWTRTNIDPHQGDWSLRSGPITNSQTSDAIVTVPAGTTRCRFWYRTSSEAAADFLRVIVGGVTQLEASGQSAWTLSPYIAVTAGSSITFRYIRNATGTRFGNLVQIDNLQFEGGAESDANADRARLDTSGSELADGLMLTGASGAYASTPDHASLDITGDLDLRAEVSTSWAVSQRGLVGKWNTNSNQRSYLFVVDADGVLRLFWSTDGVTSLSQPSSTKVPKVNGRLAVRVTIDVNDGSGNRVVTFYTSDAIDGTWTQLGDVITTAGTTSIFSGTAVLEVGAWNAGDSGQLRGAVHAAEVRSGIGGTVVAAPDFDAQSVGATSFADSTGKTWTVNGGASIIGDVSDSATTMQVATTSGPLWVTDLSGLDLTGVSGAYASSIDAPPLDITGDIDIRVEAALDDWSSTVQSLISKYVTTGEQRSYRLRVSSTGTLQLQWSTDGTSTGQSTATSTIAVPATSERLAVRATLDVNNGAGGRTVTFYTSTSIDGVWTQLGSPVTVAGVTSIFSGTAALEVGSVNSGTVELATGVVYAAEIRSSIDGAIVAQPRFNGQAPGTTGFTDGFGRAWTVNGGASIGSLSTIDLSIGGEVVRATSISGSSSPQTFRVTRSINTVTKTQTAGTAVSLAQPMILALGS